MYILGINAFHGDSSACLLKDGKVIAALEEERIRRVKHWAGFPRHAIAFCLREAGITMEDVGHVAVSRDPRANILSKAVYVVKSRMKLGTVFNRLANSGRVSGIGGLLQEYFPVSQRCGLKMKIHGIEHHRSHLASSFFASSFSEAALLSIDGFGDFSSTMTGIGRENKIEVSGSVKYPHSIGIFYTAFTQLLGFNNYGDEYKVMGLAPYGNPRYVGKLEKILQLTPDGYFLLADGYFRHFNEGVNMNWNDGAPTIAPLYTDQLQQEFGFARKKNEALSDYHRDLAASVQVMCEHAIMHLANHLQATTGCKNLCLAGGVAQNSVANGKITLQTKFEDVYVPSAGHDAGTCIGAALWVHHHILGNSKRRPLLHAYLGSGFSPEDIQQFLDDRGVEYKRFGRDDALLAHVVAGLVAGKVIGWFQGRSEFGPRALGHRSILVDPRRDDAKELLNRKIKRRESFRPFAPSILRERVGEWFEQDSDVPFMEKVFVIRKEKRGLIPAVTHVDGTGRLQSVDCEHSPRYYALIRCFEQQTGVPILLNTSFNENEPIVDRPEEAYDCFHRTNMDMLILGDFIVER